MFNVGIMGTGWVATMRHIPAFRREKRATIQAIYNPTGTLANDCAKKYNIPNSFTNLQEFLHSPIDVVVVCTPPRTHAELIEAALLAGKHVLTEKPMTMTEADGMRLAELAANKNLILCPSHNFLYGRGMQQAKKLILNGKLGDVTSAMGLQWSSWDRLLPSWYNDLPGGLFFDESPHLLYLLEAFLGPLTVKHTAFQQQKIANGKPFERFDAELVGTHASGTISAWFGAPVSEWAIMVTGTNGAFVLDVFRDILIFIPKEGTRTASYLIRSIANMDKQMWGGLIHWIFSRYTKGSHLFGVDVVIKKFLDAIEGKGAPPVTAKDGARIVGLIEQIVKAK